MTHHIKILLVTAASGVILAACGGGGSSSTPTPTPVVVTPPTNSNPVFQSGSFDPASDFVAQCQSPRTGTDPLTDAPFADTDGSTLIEKFWIRSWSHETYLWNNEIEDVDPNSIADKIDYFDVMKSFELTDSGSGREKDDFHFSEDTESFVARRNSEATSGYGFNLTSLGPVDEDGFSIPPRDFRILYTEPDSPAAAEQDGHRPLSTGLKFWTRQRVKSAMFCLTHSAPLNQKLLYRKRSPNLRPKRLTIWFWTFVIMAAVLSLSRLSLAI